MSFLLITDIFDKINRRNQGSFNPGYSFNDGSHIKGFNILKLIGIISNVIIVILSLILFKIIK